jgi:hypothetical protein
MENTGLIGYLILGGTPGLQNPALLDSSPYNPLPSFDHFYSLMKNARIFPGFQVDSAEYGLFAQIIEKQIRFIPHDS